MQPRFLIVLACFLATMTAYIERVGFSIAFTAMCSKVGRRGGWQQATAALLCDHTPLHACIRCV